MIELSQSEWSGSDLSYAQGAMYQWSGHQEVVACPSHEKQALHRQEVVAWELWVEGPLKPKGVWFTGLHMHCLHMHCCCGMLP